MTSKNRKLVTSKSRKSVMTSKPQKPATETLKLSPEEWEALCNMPGARCRLLEAFEDYGEAGALAVIAEALAFSKITT